MSARVMQLCDNWQLSATEEQNVAAEGLGQAGSLRLRSAVHISCQLILGGSRPSPLPPSHQQLLSFSSTFNVASNSRSKVPSSFGG